jgi:hypothetical protein
LVGPPMTRDMPKSLGGPHEDIHVGQTRTNIAAQRDLPRRGCANRITSNVRASRSGELVSGYSPRGIRGMVSGTTQEPSAGPQRMAMSQGQNVDATDHGCPHSYRRYISYGDRLRDRGRSRRRRRPRYVRHCSMRRRPPPLRRLRPPVSLGEKTGCGALSPRPAQVPPSIHLRSADLADLKTPRDGDAVRPPGPTAGLAGDDFSSRRLASYGGISPGCRPGTP